MNSKSIPVRASQPDPGPRPALARSGARPTETAGPGLRPHQFRAGSRTRPPRRGGNGDRRTRRRRRKLGSKRMQSRRSRPLVLPRLGPPIFRLRRARAVRVPRLLGCALARQPWATQLRKRARSRKTPHPRSCPKRLPRMPRALPATRLPTSRRRRPKRRQKEKPRLPLKQSLLPRPRQRRRAPALLRRLLPRYASGPGGGPGGGGCSCSCSIRARRCQT